MAASRFILAFIGLPVAGFLNPAVSALAKAAPAGPEQVISELQLKADRQFVDHRRNVAVAEGNVTAHLGASAFGLIESNTTSASRACLPEVR